MPTVAGCSRVVSDFFDSWAYWGLLTALMTAAAVIGKARLVDYRFLVLLYVCQYICHATLVYGIGDPITQFCIAFLLLLLVFVRLPLLERTAPRQYDDAATTLDRRWIGTAKTYLLIYYLARLALYPFAFGELFLDDRLEAQQDNRLFFFMGLAVWPAIATVLYAWIRDQRRLRLVDWPILLVVVLGVLGSGSKAAVLPLLVSYVAVSSYLGRKSRINLPIVLGASVLVAMSYYLLTIFFPFLGPREIGVLVQYRIVANTDNLEYLYVTGLRPSDFPFAGVGALVPMLAKLVGYPFEYSPGVWLHGSRFGEWRGFGPNSGMVMDYFGNLGWAGLLAAAFFGIYVRRCARAANVIGCSFLSIAYFGLMDSALFSVPLLFWAGVYVALRITLRLRLPVVPPLGLLHVQAMPRGPSWKRDR